MNLNEIVMASLEGIQREGFIEATVDKVLRKTLADAIESSLQSYSDFGKELKNQVKEKLQINLDRLDIAQYNTLILNAVKEHLEKAVHINGVEKINESLEDLLSNIKTEYKLSELVEEMKGYVDEDDRPSEITLIVDGSSRILTHVYMDELPDVSKYNCKYRLSIRENGTLSYADIGDRKFDNRVIMGGLFEFEHTLFRIYASGAKITIDEDDVDLYYPGEDY